jgi:hypothetical protein
MDEAPLLCRLEDIPLGLETSGFLVLTLAAMAYAAFSA